MPGMVVSELKGSMADLTEEEERELKRTDQRHADGVGIRRDFSVIHSKQLKKNHLFLGPARFVNVRTVFFSPPNLLFFLSINKAKQRPFDSMIAITMSNCSAKGVTSPFESSSQSVLGRR